MKITFTFSLLLCFFLFLACRGYKDLPKENLDTEWKVKQITPTVQPKNGDPEKGFEYLIYGNYIGSGIPWTFIEKKMENKQDKVLNRTGNAAHASYLFNVYESKNGVEVMSGNCFACHASQFNNEVIFGLGNSLADFTDYSKFKMGVLNTIIKTKYSKKSKERAAFSDYGFFAKHIAPYITPPIQGVNPAFRLEEACFQNRDEEDLKLNKKDNFKMLKYTLASDTPPLWNVKKKNALYYNGMGRGDFSKLLMQASVLGISDSTAASKMRPHFEDVLAWLESLEPPKFPKNINQTLAQEGKTLFEESCAKCHGHYGKNEAYPNKLVSLSTVKTDPYYARYFTQSSKLTNWYNESWFGQSDPRSKLEPSEGYIAPPLDGIWITAPYLHNGSIPDLNTLLNSTIRPKFWQRTGKNDDYNYEKVGWNYAIVEKSKGDWIYDTTLPGYGNQGHYFGDKFSKNEREAVIEYLKTL